MDAILIKSTVSNKRKYIQDRNQAQLRGRDISNLKQEEVTCENVALSQ